MGHFATPNRGKISLTTFSILRLIPRYFVVHTLLGNGTVELTIENNNNKLLYTGGSNITNNAKNMIITLELECSGMN